MPICPVCSTSNPEGAVSCEQCDSSLDDVQATVVVTSNLNETQASPLSGASGETPPPDSLSPGVVITHRYEIVRVLGHGGMGAVYQVLDRELERTIALKTIRPELTGNSSVLRRLKQETLLTRQIGHPNVVRVFDLGVAGRLRFITMEYVDGEDLRMLLDRVGKLSPQRAIPLMKQICSGLEAAHAEDVYHRDLKPRNILLGRDNRVRIADFGLARSIEETGLTRTGAIIGTPHYMSPEQASGVRTDARSDIFSLGVVFYECLTGKLPFPSGTIADSYLSRTRNRARPIASVDPTIPASLAAVVMRCLETDPARRFQSAREVLDALNARSDEQPSPQEPASGILQPGTMLGSRYRIEMLAGEGGMGKVYRAADLELDRTVALKVVHPDLAKNASYLNRLKREISLASQISHKHILRIHDLGEAGGVRFVSMAWADGEDLAHLIRRSGVLAERSAIRIAEEICEGLTAAHVHGVVHRDLKPSNILLDSNGHACVADFGIAIGRTPVVEAEGVKAAGEIVGTPRYMSPEQAEGKTADARSDIYSLGLILYEMTTGAIPFRDDSIFQTLALRVSENPKSPKTLNPALSDQLTAIILRCLERDPDKRYQTAQDLLADIKRLAAGPPEHIARRATPRRPILLVAASVLLVAAGLASWFYLTKRPPSAPASTEAFEPGGRYIAVLPFRSLSSDANTKYEAEGIADAISARLFSLSAVHAVSTPALERVNLNQTESAIAQQVGANLIVRGTLQSEGEHLQVFVNLDDVQKNRVVWSGSFSGLRWDLFALEDHVASAIVDALNIKPSLQDQERRPMPDTQNIPAYDLYLQGRDVLKQRNVAGAKQALNDFQQAVNKDQDFALAWAGIADASLFLYRSTKDASWAQKALLAAREAEQRNRTLSEVHFALGSADSATGRYAEAVEEIKHALELTPNSDEGYIRLARAFLSSGQGDAAVTAAKKAVELNPFYWYNHKQLGFIYQQIGKMPEALAEFKRQVELNPHDATGFLNIGAMYYLDGKLKDSIPYFKKASEIQPNFDQYANLGTVYYQLGQYQDAIAMTKKAIELNPNSSIALRNLAQMYQSAGQQANASATFDRAIEAAYRSLQVNSQNAEELGTLATCYAGKGSFDKARETLSSARAINPKDRDLMYDEAVLDAQEKRFPDALAALTRALENGSSFDEASRDPALIDVRRLPQFAALQKRFGAKSSNEKAAASKKQ
ncbi:MAG: protein kinase [Acidobacteriaceae bacterium]|nr:protein kinase [Acidobacteriaceae bacterium]